MCGGLIIIIKNYEYCRLLLTFAASFDRSNERSGLTLYFI